MLVGNKCDLEEKRVITEEQGRELAREFGLDPSHFYESSAKTRKNINEIFEDLVRQVVANAPAKKDKRCVIF